MTRSEVILWQALRGKRLAGVRFRRQHVLGPYVVDFYCASSKLAIEVDGGIHWDDDAVASDARRDRWMAGQGVKVLRIPDRLVLENLNAALGMIAGAMRGEPTRG